MLNDLLIKYHRVFKKSPLIDDNKFRKVCESKEAIEEILSTVLNDETLKVVEIIKQSNEGEPIFHGVILDCKCRLKTKEIVNIEVQVANDDNPVYRMRYNGSILTVENSPKSKRFKYNQIPKLILIMFCNFDLFKKKMPIYEIERRIKNTNILAEDGVRELYINLKATSKNKKLKSLFKIMTTANDTDETIFPKLSKVKQEINNLYIGGENNMSGLDLLLYKGGLKEGRTEGLLEGRQEGRSELIIQLYKENIISKEYAAKTLNITVEEFVKML